MTETKKEILCLNCNHPVVMAEDDEKFNKIRLDEQKELRAKGDEFKFKLRYTCSQCGKVFIEKTLRRR